MDSFTLAIFLGVAAVSLINPDWRNNPAQGWAQVATMACSVGFLLAYPLVRGASPF